MAFKSQLDDRLGWLQWGDLSSPRYLGLLSVCPGAVGGTEAGVPKSEGLITAESPELPSRLPPISLWALASAGCG